MESQTYHWSGLLLKNDDGTLSCTLTDSLRIHTLHLTGTKVAGGYELMGIPGPNLKEYQVMDIDGEFR